MQSQGHKTIQRPTTPAIGSTSRMKVRCNGAPDDRADENLETVEQPGGVLDAPDPAKQKAEWQVALKQATQAAQMMGQMPLGITLTVDEVLRPRFTGSPSSHASCSCRQPRTILGECRTAGTSRPGCICRIFARSPLPSIVVVVDSSTSTHSVLPAFKADLQSIVEECQPESTIVIMADAMVQLVDEFQGPRRLSLTSRDSEVRTSA